MNTKTENEMQWCNTDHQQSIKVLIVGKEGSASGERTQNINFTEVKKSTTSDISH